MQEKRPILIWECGYRTGFKVDEDNFHSCNDDHDSALVFKSVAPVIDFFMLDVHIIWEHAGRGKRYGKKCHRNIYRSPGQYPTQCFVAEILPVCGGYFQPAGQISTDRAGAVAGGPGQSRPGRPGKGPFSKGRIASQGRLLRSGIGKLNGQYGLRKCSRFAHIGAIRFHKKKYKRPEYDPCKYSIEACKGNSPAA
jgi:hypothetical protein